MSFKTAADKMVDHMIYDSSYIKGRSSVLHLAILHADFSFWMMDEKVSAGFIPCYAHVTVSTVPIPTAESNIAFHSFS